MLPAIGAVAPDAEVYPVAEGVFCIVADIGVNPGAEVLDDIGAVGLIPPTACAAAACFMLA
jgi:hypothetical protein